MDLIIFLLNLRSSYNITYDLFTEACWMGHWPFTFFQGQTVVSHLARGAGTANCTGTTSFGCILWITASMTMSARILTPTCIGIPRVGQRRYA